MSVIIDKSKNLNTYSCATVYLKNGSTPKVIIGGKIVSVVTDSYTISIQTETNFACFDANDVISIVFA